VRGTPPPIIHDHLLLISSHSLTLLFTRSQVTDCDGNCLNPGNGACYGYDSCNDIVGDGYCEDSSIAGTYADYNFNCAEFDYDGGECEGTSYYKECDGSGVEMTVACCDAHMNDDFDAICAACPQEVAAQVAAQVEDYPIETMCDGAFASGGEGEEEEAACVDTVPGWADAWGDSCQAYADNGWCSSWGSEMGTGSDGSTGTAGDSCCVCGGGAYPEPEAGTFKKKLHPPKSRTNRNNRPTHPPTPGDNDESYSYGDGEGIDCGDDNASLSAFSGGMLQNCGDHSSYCTDDSILVMMGAPAGLFLSVCPETCGVCEGMTAAPTPTPTDPPTNAPTATPTPPDSDDDDKTLVTHNMGVLGQTCSEAVAYCADDSALVSMGAPVGWFASTCKATCDACEDAFVCEGDDDEHLLEATGGSMGACEDWKFLCEDDSQLVQAGAAPGWFAQTCCGTCTGMEEEEEEEEEEETAVACFDDDATLNALSGGQLPSCAATSPMGFCTDDAMLQAGGAPAGWYAATCAHTCGCPSAQDDGPSCVFTDCSGTCATESICQGQYDDTCETIYNTWTVDEYCDDGDYGFDFNCMEHGYDNGACGDAEEDLVCQFHDCDGECWTNSECYSMFGEICDDVLEYMLTNDECDDGSDWPVNLDCDAFEFDAGACLKVTHIDCDGTEYTDLDCEALGFGTCDRMVAREIGDGSCDEKCVRVATPPRIRPPPHPLTPARAGTCAWPTTSTAATAASLTASSRASPSARSRTSAATDSRPGPCRYVPGHMKRSGERERERRGQPGGGFGGSPPDNLRAKQPASASEEHLRASLFPPQKEPPGAARSLSSPLPPLKSTSFALHYSSLPFFSLRSSTASSTSTRTRRPTALTAAALPPWSRSTSWTCSPTRT
jgi:hypothetical protein